MKRRTFEKWLKEYAEAYMELQMAGSQPTEPEQREARDAAVRRMFEARRRLETGLVG